MGVKDTGGRDKPVEIKGPSYSSDDLDHLEASRIMLALSVRCKSCVPKSEVRLCGAVVEFHEAMKRIGELVSSGNVSPRDKQLNVQRAMRLVPKRYAERLLECWGDHFPTYPYPRKSDKSKPMPIVVNSDAKEPT